MTTITEVLSWLTILPATDHPLVYLIVGIFLVTTLFLGWRAGRGI